MYKTDVEVKNMIKEEIKKFDNVAKILLFEGSYDALETVSYDKEDFLDFIKYSSDLFYNDENRLNNLENIINDTDIISAWAFEGCVMKIKDIVYEFEYSFLIARCDENGEFLETLALYFTNDHDLKVFLV